MFRSLAGLALAASACGQGVDRVTPVHCDPVEDTGCPPGEHCRLGDGGRKACLDQETVTDVACTPGSCVPGEACARVEGYLACRPVCTLVDDACPDGTVCSYALDETHGVCVGPCRVFPSEPIEDCPAGTCAPILGLPFPVCMAVGEARSGEACREVRCGRALACLEAEDGIFCRPLCEAGRDDQCPAPWVCSGEVAERDLGYCRAPAE